MKWALDGEVSEEAVWQKDNYVSAAKHEEFLWQYLDQEVEDGLMVRMTFVKAFGEDRALAALAVLVEDPITGKKRVIHDATHGVRVNHRIKCRNKVRMPGPREKRALLEQHEGEKQVILSLVGTLQRHTGGSSTTGASGVSWHAGYQALRRLCMSTQWALLAWLRHPIGGCG